MRKTLLFAVARETLGQCVGEGSYTGSGGECLCRDGFVLEGNACRELQQCVEYNPCDSLSQNCTPSIDGPTCECKTGFSKKGDQCFDIDECNERENLNPCLDLETPECINLLGSYKCVAKQCEKGQKLEFGFCVDIGTDECQDQSDYCSETSRCFNTADNYEEVKGGSYECRCKDGFQLTQDGLNCEDIDECANADSVCKFAVEYRGSIPDYSLADAWDEPKEQIECRNTPGSYECACPKGFENMGNECYRTEYEDREYEETTTTVSDTLADSNSGTTETLNTAGAGNWVSDNLVVIFAAGGTLFLLLAVGIIICIVKSRNKKRDQNRDYNSGTLQTLRQDSNDGYHVAKERDFSETKLDRQDSFETLDSVEVDQVPLSKFDQPSNKNSIRPKGDFPAPPPNLMESPAIVRGGPHGQSVANQNYTQVNPSHYQ